LQTERFSKKRYYGIFFNIFWEAHLKFAANSENFFFFVVKGLKVVEAAVEEMAAMMTGMVL
jgi:hypothetical protein